MAFVVPFSFPGNSVYSKAWDDVRDTGVCPETWSHGVTEGRWQATADPRIAVEKMERTGVLSAGRLALWMVLEVQPGKTPAEFPVAHSWAPSMSPSSRKGPVCLLLGAEGGRG